MRCYGCDAMMSSSEMIRINPGTGEVDDLCRVCRDPTWDTGIEKDLKTDKVISWHNEVDNWKFDKPKGGMGGIKSITDHIMNYGKIATDT